MGENYMDLTAIQKPATTFLFKSVQVYSLKFCDLILLAPLCTKFQKLLSIFILVFDICYCMLSSNVWKFCTRSKTFKREEHETKRLLTTNNIFHSYNYQPLKNPTNIHHKISTIYSPLSCLILLTTTWNIYAMEYSVFYLKAA